MAETNKANEIEHVEKLNEALKDNAVGTNPMFEHIELCENLKRYCQKQLKPEEPA